MTFQSVVKKQIILIFKLNIYCSSREALKFHLCKVANVKTKIVIRNTAFIPIDDDSLSLLQVDNSGWKCLNLSIFLVKQSAIHINF